MCATLQEIRNTGFIVKREEKQIRWFREIFINFISVESELTLVLDLNGTLYLKENPTLKKFIQAF